MKAFIYVSLKPSVLDPQGQAIQAALARRGHRGIQDVRQGKRFVLELDPALSRESAREEVERVAREVLANPVIEEYAVRWEE